MEGEALTGVVLLADDLTGAGDAGMECLRAGWAVRCAFALRPSWERGLPTRPGEAAVLDLETRRLDAAAAGRRAAAAGARLRALGRRPSYYKMDSTLRGNFAMEVAALRAAARSPLAWIVPANPSQGRWTVGGRQYVRGVPVERTAFAHDALQPVRSSDVRALAERVFGPGRVALASLTDVRRGSARLRRLRRGWVRGRARAVVADAVTEADLAAIAGALGPRDLPAGAAPLARFVLGPRTGATRSARVAVPRGLRWLVVVGSLNPVSRAQVREARKAGRGTILVPFMPRGRHLNGAQGWPFDKAQGWPFDKAQGWRIATELATRAARLVRERRPGGLVLSGGLTAVAVCLALGISALRLVGEIEPGLVLSEAPFGPGVLRIVTKPGGFGDPGCLRRLLGGRA
mgnify:CR=1 FL=1